MRDGLYIIDRCHPFFLPDFTERRYLPGDAPNIVHNPSMAAQEQQTPLLDPRPTRANAPDTNSTNRSPKDATRPDTFLQPGPRAVLRLYTIYFSYAVTLYALRTWQSAPFLPSAVRELTTGLSLLLDLCVGLPCVLYFWYYLVRLTVIERRERRERAKQASQERTSGEKV